MKLSDCLVDSKAIESGDWQEISPAKGDEPAVRVKVRGYGNSDYRRLRSELVAAASLDAGLGEMIPQDRAEEIDRVLFCQTILVDWEGFTEDDGATAIKYTPEYGLQLFASADARPLQDLIERLARGVSLRRKQKADEAAKN